MAASSTETSFLLLLSLLFLLLFWILLVLLVLLIFIDDLVLGVFDRLFELLLLIAVFEFSSLSSWLLKFLLDVVAFSLVLFLFMLLVLLTATLLELDFLASLLIDCFDFKLSFSLSLSSSCCLFFDSLFRRLAELLVKLACFG